MFRVEEKTSEKITGAESEKEMNHENDRQKIFKALDDAMKMKSEHRDIKPESEKKEEINSVSSNAGNNDLENETVIQKVSRKCQIFYDVY